MISACDREGELLIIIRHGPHGTSWLREGLDVVLVTAAFERQVSLLFMGEGVLALVAGQREGALGQKGTHPTLQMLEMYDVDSLYVEQEAMARYGLSADRMIMDADEVSDQDIAALVQHHGQVLTF